MTFEIGSLKKQKKKESLDKYLLKEGYSTVGKMLCLLRKIFFSSVNKACILFCWYDS